MANERRLIDANTLKQNIESRLKNGMIIGWLCSIVDDAKTVDAVEVVHGRWIERQHDCVGGGWFTLFHCSECDTPSAKPRNFCSFCGAKMDGERKDK